MGDFPSALVLMGILPLAALLFFACLLWSASQLLRVRKDGAKFAVPFAICVATLLALQYAPLQTDLPRPEFLAPPRRPRSRSSSASRTASSCRMSITTRT